MRRATILDWFRDKKSFYAPQRRAERLREVHRNGRLQVESLEARTLLAATSLTAPLDVEEPLGALVYSSNEAGTISAGDEVDSFAIHIDAGQTITLIVEPDDSLQPTIELLDPDSVSVGAATASLPGEDILVQTVNASIGGSYIINVAGADASTGDYQATLRLNAAAERETIEGTDNNSLETAQNIDPTFISLGFGSAQRGAVVGSFEPPAAINLGTGVNTVSAERNPDVSGDGLTLVFNSDRPGGEGGRDLYMATRESRSEPFSNVVNLGAGINTAHHEAAPTLSEDGLTLLFASNRPGGQGGNDLYAASRASTDDPFANVINLGAPLNTISNDSHPTLSADGRTLFFNSTRSGGFGSSDIYMATRADTTSPFGAPVNLGPGVNSSSQESGPSLSDDQLALYFHSNRPGASGGTDVFVATRDNAGDLFGDVAVLDSPVNSPFADQAPAISADGEDLFFESDRLGGAGSRDLYRAALPGADWYALTLSEGESATVALSSTVETGTRTLEFQQNEAGYAGTVDTQLSQSLPDTVFATARSFTVDGDEPSGSGLDTQVLIQYEDLFGDGLGQLDSSTEIVSAQLQLQITNPGTSLQLFRMLQPWQDTDTWNSFGGNGVQPDGVEAAVAPEAFVPSPTTGPLSIDVTNSLQAWQQDPGQNLGWVLLPTGNNGVDFSSSEGLTPPKLIVEIVSRVSPLTLLDEAGNLLASGEQATGDVGQIIRDFVAPATGTYFARIDGLAGGDYTLVTTRGATFDNEPPQDVPLPETVDQEITLTGTVQGHVGSGLNLRDVYRFEVVAGDELAINTMLPADGPGEFRNLLDLTVELYDSDGLLVATGSDETLFHTATLSGSYAVHVVPENQTSGEYVLNVSGHTGQLPLFEVVSSEPADGELVNDSQSRMIVQLSDAVLLSSVDAADLVVNGTPARSVQVLGSRTLSFELPDPLEGLNEVSLAAGALLDLQQQPLEAFHAQFTFDSTAPRVTATSVQQGDTLPAGSPLVLTVQFDETLSSATIDVSDVVLEGLVTGSHTPLSVNYEPATSVVTAEFGPLAEDRYHVTLLSGDTGFQDQAGNALDGEALAFPLPPNVSGDGIAGGDFIVEFSTDVVIAPYPTPTQAKAPDGSLIYDPAVQGVISLPGDHDTYRIQIDPNQTLTVLVEPDETLRPAVDVTGPGGAVLGSASASAAGDAVAVQTLSAGVAGQYLITARGGGGSTGFYSLQLVLNAALESEAFGGPANNTRDGAQDLNGTFLDLGDDHAQRGAVLGSLPSFIGQPVVSEDFEAGALTGSWTTNSSDGAGRIQVTDLFGTAAGDYALLMDRNTGGSNTLNEAVWSVDLSGLEDATLRFFHTNFNDEAEFLPENFLGSVNGDGVSISDDGFRWHTILNAPDVATGQWEEVVVDLAAEAAQAGLTLGSDFRIKFQQFDNSPLPSDGRGYDEISITTPAPADEDWYRFSLDDGESASLVLTEFGEGGLELQLYNAADKLLATGESGNNVTRRIDGLVDTTTDGSAQDYFVHVLGGDTAYSLVVMRNAAFDAEPNNALDISAQDLTLTGAALGALRGATLDETPSMGLIEDSSPWGSFANQEVAAELGIDVTIVPSFLLGAVDLAQFDVLLLAGDQGPSTYNRVASNMDAIEAFVSAGGTWLVNYAASSLSTPYTFDVLPDADELTFVGRGDSDIDVLDASSGLITGPGGTIDDTNLDGGSFSTHGFTTGPLPPATNAVLSTGDPEQIVELDYPLGAGQVIVHTVPVEFYDGGPHPLGTVFHRNLFAFAATAMDAEDFYQVAARAGDMLTVDVLTPAAGSGQFVNELDVGVELYDPAGVVVATSSSGHLTHRATADGPYAARVFSEGNQGGEYALRISGHTGQLPPFEVVASHPADGASGATAPAEITIDLSDAVLLSSVDASDLTVNGIPATAVHVVAPDTLRYELPPLAEDVNQVSMAPGALVDLQNQLLEPFDIELTLDTTPPRVTFTSVQQAETVPAGVPLVVTVGFDETLDSSQLDADDVILEGTTSGPHAPVGFNYDSASSLLTLEFEGLPEDNFTLTLLSGTGQFEDLVGNDLDGEPLAFPIPPNVSGDGIAGGPFSIDFATDFVVAPLPVPLEAKLPVGSLVYDPPIGGAIGEVGDIDQFTVDVDADQTVALFVEAAGTLQPTVRLFDPSHAELASATAPGAGQGAFIQSLPVTGPGTYTVEVSGAAATTGRYNLSFILNAVLEEETHGGLSNDDGASAQDLDSGFTLLADDSAARTAVLGALRSRVLGLGPNINTADNDRHPAISADGLTLVFASDRPGGEGAEDLYMATRASTSEPFSNVVNLGPGVNSEHVDSSPALSADGLQLYFDSNRPGGLGGKDLYRASRASASDRFGTVINLGDQINSNLNEINPVVTPDGLTIAFASNGIPPFSFNHNDLWMATRTSTSEPFSGRVPLGPEVNSPSNESTPDLSPDGLLLLFQSTRPGGFGAHDLYRASRQLPDAPFFENVHNLGAHINTPFSERGPSRSVDGAELFFESNRPGGEGGIDIYRAVSNEDWYRFSMADGESVTLALSAFDQPDINMQLYDAGSTLVAQGVADASNLEQVVNNFVDTTTDATAETYFVRISGGEGRYNLVLTRNADFDTESNDGPGGRSQDITPVGTALGSVGGEPADDSDAYLVRVNQGDILTVETLTPGDGPFEPQSALDPVVELYDPAGHLVASDDNSGPDERNAALTHAAEASGAYHVVVRGAETTRGDYVVRVGGYSGGVGPFEVTALNVPDGATIGASPASLTFDFSDAVRLDTLQASDVLINGVAAQGYSIIDGDTVEFALPLLSDGVYNVALSAGAVQNVRAVPVELFVSQFTVDTTAPRVTYSSLQEGDVSVGNELTFVAVFDEALDADALDVDDIVLVGENSGAQVPATLDYDPQTSRLTVRYDVLPEDRYVLTLKSGDEALQDAVGNDLDGEPLAFPVPPNISGNGEEGGDFVVDFDVDYATSGAHSFQRLNPLGSLIFRSMGNTGVLQPVADGDDFQFFAEGGQTISAIVSPDDPSATLEIALLTTGASAVAPSPGSPAVLPATPIGSDGTYRIRVTGDTATSYSLDIFRNTSLEAEVGETGGPLPIDGSFVGPGSGRFGAIGTSVPQELQVESLVYGVQPNTGMIVKVDPATGALVDAFAAPDGLQPGHQNIGLSLAEGGDSLIYVNSDVDPSVVWRLDPVTGGVLSIETKGSQVTDGLGFDRGLSGEQYLFISHSNQDLRRQEGFSGAEVNAWATGEPVGGLGGDDAGRQFGYFIDGFIHEYDPLLDTNSFISTLPAPADDIEGLAYDGVHLYASTAAGSLFVLDPDTGAVRSEQFVPGGSLYGLGADSRPTRSQRGAYFRSVVGPPWGSSANESAMNNAFGPQGWDDLRYETVVASDVFSEDYSLVFMEGGDSNANELEVFLETNIALIEEFVASGGVVFINAAPTEGDGMSFGFDGISLNYRENSNNAVAADPNHPLFSGPALPVASSYTGTAFGHATVVDNSGADLEPVLVNSFEGIVLGELSWGAGAALFGGMTTPNFHAPQPQAGNLRANILSYGESLAGSRGIELPDIDRFTLDLTGRAGHSLDIVLDGQADADFSGALLQLTSADGSTVLATAVPDPLGTGAANYDLGILGFEVPADGVYTLQLRTVEAGQYGILVTDSIVFETEPNDAQNDVLRHLNGAGTALGFLGDEASRGLLYGSDRNGQLFTIDVATGVGELVGFLPTPSTEIEYDPATGRAFSQLPDGAFAGVEFDITTGEGIGPVVSNGFAFNGLEWVDDVLYGTAISGPRGPSQLRILDPFAGTSSAIGPTGAGPISGLAYLPETDTLYGIAGGPGPATLYTIDRATGQATPIGSTGIQAGSLETGPDGNLYAGGTGAQLGELYRIDPLTGAGTFVGTTGFGPVTGLLLGPVSSANDLARPPRTSLPIPEGKNADVLPRSALTAFVPHNVSVRDLAQQLEPVGAVPRRSPAAGTLAQAVIVEEVEPNNTLATAQPVALGFDAGQFDAVDIHGDLALGPPPNILITAEENGAIPFATETGLTEGSSVIVSSVIGDGAFAATSGDYDWYAIRDVASGQQITIDVDASAIGSSLDPVIGLYDSSGNLLASNDDADGLDSFLSFVAPQNDDYFAVIFGFFSGFQLDPFDPSTGMGAASTGFYDITIGLNAGDIDVFQLELEPGDILGANVSGGAGRVTLWDASGSELMGSSQDATFIHPDASPLPGGGNASLSWVTDTAGTYYVSAQTGTGSYDLELRLFRPALEQSLTGSRQVVFLDFDGATIDTSIFGAGGTATLSPLGAFLGGWGLTGSDEDAVIDAIVATVEENLSSDIRALGNNGDYAASGVPGEFDIEILNSRDHADPFGQPNVSRVIVGGSIDELGIGTIGIAESIDVGNFETRESAVVLLDLLSAPAFDPNSLNQYPLDPSVSIIDLIGAGVGNITAHEAGHFLAAWHTDQFNGVPNIMDQGGFLDNTVGVGPDRVFGTDDDVDVDFGDDTFVPNEGFSGVEDTLNSIAFGLSTGLIDPSLVGPQILSINPPPGTLVNELGISNIGIEFNEQLAAPSALNPDNYLLLESGPNGLFEEGSSDDVVIPVVPSLLDGGLFVDLAITGGFAPLAPGSFQLTIDGSDSGLLDLDGNPLNTLTGPGGGRDDVHMFEIVFDLDTGGDLYAVDLTPGEILRAGTATPLDATLGTPINSLDPALLVLDPTGIPVAGDADSLDGKNARVDLAAHDSGTYQIQVLAEEGSGEYLLNVDVVSTGDMNTDGFIDFGDIDPFVLALISGDQFLETYGISTHLIGDIDGDGDMDYDDIDPFASLLASGKIAANRSSVAAIVDDAHATEPSALGSTGLMHVADGNQIDASDPNGDGLPADDMFAALERRLLPPVELPRQVVRDLSRSSATSNAPADAFREEDDWWVHDSGPAALEKAIADLSGDSKKIT